MSRIARALAWLALLALCATAGVAGAQTRAWLDRDRVALGETTTLNIETDANGAPDYAPLLRDFDLGGQSSRQQLSWANGSASSRSLYAVALRPRRDGLLRIPALRVGGGMTAPLTLLVTAAPAATAGGGDVFIESEADTQEPYVQQAVGWVVRLYSAVPLIAGQLDQDEPAGASLQRIGEDAQYRREVGGRSYVVTERRYLLIPERSGELVVPPARFEGRGSGNAFDQLFGDGQSALHAVARPRVLKVRPIPANAAQPWLPLRSLSLRYVTQPVKARVGAAVDLVVEVTADGATASQLPELVLPAVDGAQVFPERGRPDESMVDGRPQVRLQRRFSLVPTRPGTLVVQGPRIDWWDSRAHEPRSATLPPVTLQVAPGAPVATTTPDAPSAANAIEAPRSRPRWMFAAVGVLACVLILVGLAWRARSTRVARPDSGMPVPAAIPSGPPPFPGTAVSSSPVAVSVPPDQIRPAIDVAPTGIAPPREPEPTLGRALDLGDLADIEAALRRLADGAGDLDTVIARLDDAAQRDAVERLRLARWAAGDASVARTRLREAFAGGPRWRVAAAPRRGLLPPLYPDA
jgi:hypothetical protein